MAQPIDLTRIMRIHFTGIKGVAMAGLALIARQMGKEVSGSDVGEEFITDPVLRSTGIEAQVGFDPVRVESKDLVVVTAAHHGKNNPEAQRAIELSIPVLMHAEALALFSRGKKVIAVAGCHGKTTTAAMIAFLLAKAGLDPSYAIGTSEITGLGFAATYGQGEYFVVEADEYMTCAETDPTPRFLYLDPWLEVVTNIDYDHPDRYRDLDETKDVFAQFVSKIKDQGKLVAGIDSQPLQAVIEGLHFFDIVRYGVENSADVRIEKVVSKEGETTYTIVDDDMSLSMKLLVPGEHNALNATAAYCVGRAVGINATLIADIMGQFRGTKRRFELVGTRDGVWVYDDYAHHPTEIKATFGSARAWFPHNRIICLFQPHTYSRTKALFSDFADSFSEVDIVVLLPIFASAREISDKSVSSDKLADAIRHHGVQVEVVASLEAARQWLVHEVHAGDIVITMGAGDVYKVGERFVKNN
jgi:UDP-N-acetylmuramate--alanine ligase